MRYYLREVPTTTHQWRELYTAGQAVSRAEGMFSCPSILSPHSHRLFVKVLGEQPHGSFQVEQFDWYVHSTSLVNVLSYSIQGRHQTIWQPPR